MKKNFKLLFYIFLFLFLSGLVGLFVSLSDLNQLYVLKSQKIKLMKNQLVQLSKRYDVLKDTYDKNQRRWESIDFLEYKQTLFQKQYPLFSQIADVVYEKSRSYGFNPNLILGMIQVESQFNPFAQSFTGAYGLMQINYSVWKDELKINRDHIYDIDYNIQLGLEILKRYYNESNGNIFRSLHLYNNGYLYNNLAYAHKVNSSIFCTNQNRAEPFKLSK